MKFTGLLLCVLAFAAVRGAKAACPPAESIRPCVCGRMSYLDFVQCANFTDMWSLQEVFDNSIDLPFEGFALNHSHVTYLSASWLTKKKIQQITVRDCSLSAFFDAVPSTDNTVSHINLFNVNILRGIQWEQFKPLKRLLDIVIQDVEIRKMGKSIAENVTPTIRKMKFKGTKTVSLEDTVFQSFKELDWFELQNAQVKTLKRSMFANPSRLWVFDFRNNRIESLPNDIFSGMERVQDIYLSGNKLVTLSEAAFSNVYENYIFNLEVQDNPLLCDCSIKWLVYSTRYVSVEGYCSGPIHLKGRHLLKLKREEFSHCP